MGTEQAPAEERAKEQPLQPSQESPESDLASGTNSDSSPPQSDSSQHSTTTLPRPIGPKSLARSDSRRQACGAPVPAKSAQRTRSISHGSTSSRSSHETKDQTEEQVTSASAANGVPRQTTARPMQHSDNHGGLLSALPITQQIPEDPEAEDAQVSSMPAHQMPNQESSGYENGEQHTQKGGQHSNQPSGQQVYQHSWQPSQPPQGYVGANDNQHTLLPAAPIPSQEDGHNHTARPMLRKQKSGDPAVIYREQQRAHDDDAMDGRGRLPSRHASEKHPRKHSTNEDQDDRGRGRTTKESGGGFFAWARSRSKSRDPSKIKDNTQAPPMPEPSEQYNPALLPSRSMTVTGVLREKSLPRKASNNNLQDGWPSYDPHAVGGVSPQRKKSLSRGPSNGGPFSRLNRKPSENNLTPHLPGSIMSQTNAHTTHHEAMVRGMGMGGALMTPTVLLTPQPSMPLNTPSTPGTSGAARGMALAMMKDGAETSLDMHASPSAQQVQSQQQMQQRANQLQQAQFQHLQLQQQKLAAAVGKGANDPTSPKSPTSPNVANQTIKMVATRIYIQTETDFKSVNLTATSTALDVLRMLQDRGTFGEPGDGRYHDRWTIFEYSKEFLIERPLRDFEVILDLMKVWETDKDNKMICKSFPARDELTAKEVARLVSPAGQANFVRPHGWVHIELKKGKWSKRYLHITDNAIYHSKDEKFSGETMLCFLRNFDVYTVQVPRKKAPTKFGFALRSSDSIHIYESPEDDYIHYVCTDNGESLRDWMTGLRAAKGIFMYHANPEIIREGVKHAIELNGESASRLTDEQVIPTVDHDPLPTENSNGSFKGNFVPAAATAGAEVNADAGTNKNQGVTSADGFHLNSLNALPMHARSIKREVTDSNEDRVQQPFNQQAHHQLYNQQDTTTLLPPMPEKKSPTSSSHTTAADSSPTGPAKPSFVAGSLLQQQVEAERQQVEMMKQQLRLREQAGVLGALDARNKESTSASTMGSNSRMPTAPLIVPDPPKFGGPGTLIERSELRAAELERTKQANLQQLQALARSGSSTLIQLGPMDGPSETERSTGKLAYPSHPGFYAQQQQLHGRSRTENSGHVPSPLLVTNSSMSGTPNYPPGGPLLRFDQEETKDIKPGLLLDRAKSTKSNSSSGTRHQVDYAGAPLKSPGIHAPPLLGYGFGGGTSSAPPPVPTLATNGSVGARGPNGRIKPLVDLGSLNGGHEILGHGLLANHQQQGKSSRKPGPLLNFS
ncbi:hypothetical protein BGZ73_002887 [Actinomortierella ambigua]|nr:hypothetical protein BGZ73_002887 [Actinomortierella ambigua]